LSCVRAGTPLIATTASAKANMHAMATAFFDKCVFTIFGLLLLNPGGSSL
jgi:hypothetical protein